MKKIPALIALLSCFSLQRSSAENQEGSGLNVLSKTGTVKDETEFAAAIADPRRKIVFCTRPFVLTKKHDFGGKHLVLWPEVLDFSGGGTLKGNGSISRIAGKADCAVFVGATVGLWEYYSGSVTWNGTKYAPLPGQGTPPSVEGTWNKNVRDVTLWKQWHDGKTNDAIEAAQNSLPRKADRLADWRGTVILPEGRYQITRPIYITTGGKVTGAGGKGTKGRNGAGETELTAAEGFGPEEKFPTGHASPIPGGGRLWDIPENYMVVFIPQNRNNQRRVDAGRGGGDGKSVFYSGLKGFQFNCAKRANGVLVHASSGSEIQNLQVDGAIENAFWWRGSDAHVARNISAVRSPVGLQFTGTNIDVTIDGVIFTRLGTGFQYTEDNNRSASIELRNVNSENTKLLFNIRNPDAISIMKFTHTLTDPQHRVGIVDISDHDNGWPPFGFKAFGSVLYAGYIEVIDDTKRDQWRVLTSQVDNAWKPQNDWAAQEFGGKRGTLDFDLQREFGKGRARRALNFPGEDAYSIPPLRH
ncbi:MAG: hypothetical protein QGG53_07650 [Planctomycetota bacterium]|jgi:hypothetical protein|nr:hypothetical protein [Planctomycetota bacterium]